MDDAPTLDMIRETAAIIAPHINRTPVHHWRGREIDTQLGSDTEVLLKLELFQHSGTFKARGALSNTLRLSDEQRRLGVTAVSAGNHAIAVSYAANILAASAKVVMLESASPARIDAARAFGAEVVIAEDGPTGFALAEHIAAEEGRSFIHPFDGLGTVLGTATVALEFVEQTKHLDALIVSIGGGGLAAGVSTATKLLNPECQIYGVEPEGADTMHRSFAAGSAQHMDHPTTIADSLAPPMALPYGYKLCRQNIDKLVKVSDEAMCVAMALLYREMKLAVEPGGAASTAALTGPLKNELKGKRVGVIICGSNLDIDTFGELIKRGEKNAH